MRDSHSNNEYDIHAEGLGKTFGPIEALRGIDLSVKKGEFYTLFGPNGAGKTTFIKILSTLAKPSSGRLTIAGRDAVKDPDGVRGVTGVVSHDPFLYENLSAFENIKFFGAMYGVHDADGKAAELIDRVGLGNRMHDLVRTFSRGMKQRLAVARAIVHDPSILLLDEPYTGLDQHGAGVFGEMLTMLKSDRRTILMTTHNIEEGLDRSDRVGILAGGRMVYESARERVDREAFREIYISRVENG
ncbi:MAG TPA: ABC transporter ATP-binding protein [Thermodesulfobacteriota bacterium]|nr:ABC transporter ATP-binding protein [Thermodesulfobacteriota bacterium]